MAQLDARCRDRDVTRLDVRATSRADEAAFLAMRDIARVANAAGIDYRIVGGQMVRLHVALGGADEPVARVTLDADVGIAAASARNPALVSGLDELGYKRPGSSNRFSRETAEGLNLVIDVLAPAYGRRMVSNQQHGDIVLDEIPGLSLALSTAGEHVDLTVTMLDGANLTFGVVVPDITSALCLKAVGWADRLATKDAVDVWRLLRAHRQRVTAPVVWRTTGVQGDAVTILRTDFARAAGAGVRTASHERSEQAEIRALTLSALRDQRPVISAER